MVLFVAAPVAAVERIAAPEEHRHGERFTLTVRAFQYQRIAHGSGQGAKTFTIEIGLIAIAQESIAMQVEGFVDGLRGDPGARQRVECDAVLEHAAPLAFGFLAFVGGEAFQVVVEVPITLVVPVELNITPWEPLRRFEGGAVLLADEQAMHRGKSTRFGEFTDGGDELRTRGSGIEIRPHQQTRARNRRERNAQHQFGVVSEAVAGVRLRPGEIEHELAI
jgi:hypothetical protein